MRPMPPPSRATATQTPGRIDIALNAVCAAHVQGAPLAGLSLDFEHLIAVYTWTNFLTAGFFGHNVACAGVEAPSRHLAGVGGVRGICIRSHAIPEALAAGSHAAAAFEKNARQAGLTTDKMLAGAAAGTVLRRLRNRAIAAAGAAAAADERPIRSYGRGMPPNPSGVLPAVPLPRPDRAT